MDVILETLRRVDLLQSLSPLQLTEILRNADRVVFNPGDTLLQRGEVCDHATLIIEGDATCLAGHVEPITDGPLPPGTILAELAMVVEIEAAATIVAETRVRAIRVLRSAVLTQMAADPSVAERMIDRISVRLRRAAEHLQAIEGEVLSGGNSRPTDEVAGLSGGGARPAATQRFSEGHSFVGHPVH